MTVFNGVNEKSVKTYEKLH